MTTTTPKPADKFDPSLELTDHPLADYSFGNRKR
jgi:hypothetical protein